MTSPNNVEGCVIKFDEKELQKAILHVKPSAAEKVSIVSEALKGVFVRANQKGILFFSTDGTMLSTYEIDKYPVKEEDQVILSSDTVDIVSKLKNEVVTMKFNSTRVEFYTPKSSYISKVIDDVAPNFEIFLELVSDGIDTVP